MASKALDITLIVWTISYVVQRSSQHRSSKGQKPGYCFSNGGQGVGYYIDEKPVVLISNTDGGSGGSEGLLIGGLVVAAAIAGSPEAQMNIAMKTNGKCCVVS